MHRQPLIHVWSPGLFDFKGGIQVYSSFLLNALQNVYPHARYRVLLTHDRIHSTPDTNPQFYGCGQLPASIRIPAFAASVIGWGLRERPDLIVTTHLNFATAAALLKQLVGTPYWAIAHGVEAWTIQRPALKRALSEADRILAVSQFTRDRLLQTQALSPDQISILPNTIDSDRFQVAAKPAHLLEKYHLQPDQPVILTVNRLAAQESFHSYDQILNALPQIQQVLPDVHYVIVGKGDDRPRLEHLIAAKQLQHCVTLAGFVPDAELGDYYNLCDVFAMPSKLEGFGIVYLEALASGKPVVGGCDGAMDALAHGQLGVLVNPDDTDAIAQTLIQILQKTYPHPLLYQPHALRQAVIDHFGRDRFQQTLTHLMHDSPLTAFL
jgi:glycosyltransferase involved in cell wall biosynthesis